MKAPALALLLFSMPGLMAAPMPHPEPRLSVEARAFKPGEIILVIIEGNDPKSAPEATLRGQALQFFPAASTGTWLAFAGLDLDVSTGPALLSALLRRQVWVEQAQGDERERQRQQGSGRSVGH